MVVKSCLAFVWSLSLSLRFEPLPLVVDFGVEATAREMRAVRPAFRGWCGGGGSGSIGVDVTGGFGWDAGAEIPGVLSCCDLPRIKFTAHGLGSFYGH